MSIAWRTGVPPAPAYFNPCFVPCVMLAARNAQAVAAAPLAVDEAAFYSVVALKSPPGRRRAA